MILRNRQTELFSIFIGSTEKSWGEEIWGDMGVCPRDNFYERSLDFEVKTKNGKNFAAAAVMNISITY